MPDTLFYILTATFAGFGLALLLGGYLSHRYATGTAGTLRGHALKRLGGCMVLTSVVTHACTGEIHPFFGLLAAAMALLMLFQFGTASQRLINHLKAKTTPNA